LIKLNKLLIKGSLILLIAFNLYFAFNYFFHFAMARMLSIADYGILVTLYSIIYILGVFTESIQTVITKYTTSESNPGRIKNIFKKGLRKGFLVSIIVFLAYLIASIPLSLLLDIEYPLMALNGLIIFFSLTLPVGRGIMQGRKLFKSLGMNMVSESLTKLIIAIILVFIGLRVYGAIAATILGNFVAFLFIFVVLRGIFSAKEIPTKTKDIYKYTAPVFVITLAIIAFFSIDVIIAKIVFHEDIAGYYAIASTLGKIIFFGTQGISRAMFPLSAEGKSKKKSSSNIFGNAFVFLIICIIAALVIFYLFPDLLVRIFAGRYIPESSSILIFVAIAISLLSITNLVLLHKLSIGKVRGAYFMLLFILVEVLLLVYFSQNLFQFSIAFITASAIFLWGSVFLMNE